MGWYGFRPYVSVGQRQANAKRELASLAKKGLAVLPVKLEGKKIASTFWGKAWCEHLESYSDFENRLPRGRTYIRNGSVLHLEIGAGMINAKVCGSELYDVSIKIKPLARETWKCLKGDCGGKIGSLVELLQGRLSQAVMELVTRRNSGLFPAPAEIQMECSCPDWAGMCKHVAAVLYGVGARFDQQPELLFTLRKVDHMELIDEAGSAGLVQTGAAGSQPIAAADLADVFGIEMDLSSLSAADAPSVSIPAARARKQPKAKAAVRDHARRSRSAKRVEPATLTRTGKTARKPKRATRSK